MAVAMRNVVREEIAYANGFSSKGSSSSNMLKEMAQEISARLEDQSYSGTESKLA